MICEREQMSVDICVAGEKAKRQGHVGRFCKGEGATPFRTDTVTKSVQKTLCPVFRN